MFTRLPKFKEMSDTATGSDDLRVHFFTGVSDVS
jgi:hypothetical protein